MLRKIQERIDRYIWSRIEELVDSQELSEAVAEKAVNYTEVIAVRVTPGDVLIVPESTDAGQIENLYRIFKGTGIVGIIAGNIDEISILRTRAIVEDEDKYLYD
jgi:hypothetical protein